MMTDAPRSPRMPRSRWGLLATAAVSIAAHAGVVAVVAGLVARTAGTPGHAPVEATDTPRPAETVHLVFVVPQPTADIVARGGGGGGNRQKGPVRRAQGVGSDAMTLRIAKRVEIAISPVNRPSPPGVLLDAKPLASGTFDQIGLPAGGEPVGLSTGPGSGGGVGTGDGTGIGSGSGPGIGRGSGGGAGGGTYVPGAGVSPPRVVHQVKPAYTPAALLERIQGTVILQVVVARDGRPTQIHIVRSLDPQGLDGQAILAVRQWRFEPGRLAGSPVD